MPPTAQDLSNLCVLFYLFSVSLRVFITFQYLKIVHLIIPVPLTLPFFWGAQTLMWFSVSLSNGLVFSAPSPKPLSLCLLCKTPSPSSIKEAPSLSGSPKSHRRWSWNGGFCCSRGETGQEGRSFFPFTWFGEKGGSFGLERRRRCGCRCPSAEIPRPQMGWRDLGFEAVLQRWEDELGRCYWCRFDSIAL